MKPVTPAMTVTTTMTAIHRSRRMAPSPAEHAATPKSGVSPLQAIDERIGALRPGRGGTGWADLRVDLVDVFQTDLVRGTDAEEVQQHLRRHRRIVGEVRAGHQVFPDRGPDPLVIVLAGELDIPATPILVPVS